MTVPTTPATAATLLGWRYEGGDEFEGTALNDTHWVPYDGINPSSGEHWNATHCVVSDGLLTLTADTDGLPGVASKVDVTYGKWETYARFPPSNDPNLAPVFLLWPHTDADWPAAGEIDVVECYDITRQSYQSWSHYAGPDGDNESEYAGIHELDMTTWHAYAVSWEPNAIRLYVDGALWCTYTSHIPTGPMHWVFQINSLGPVTGAAQVQIDWIRGYA